jgi:glucoside 3-dehydrogenase (cytochrome c) hitch-hiker subunit
VADYINRREAIQLAAAAAITAPLVGQTPPRFFTPAEFALVDELTEMIIPADAHSPGAHAAGVAAYLDFRLSESPDADWQKTWREGLKGVDALSKEMNDAAFLDATPAQRTAVLTAMSKNEEAPVTPSDEFFRELKESTARAYYTSKIGIHQEIEYKGNVMLQEFAGYEVK